MSSSYCPLCLSRWGYLDDSPSFPYGMGLIGVTKDEGVEVINHLRCTRCRGLSDLARVTVDGQMRWQWQAPRWVPPFEKKEEEEK